MADQRDYGSGAFARHIKLSNRMEELERLHSFLDATSHEAAWPDRLRRDLLLATEELISNTIAYGFPQGGEHSIDISVRFGFEEGEVVLTIEDDGIAFDPLTQEPPDLTLSIEDRAIGGLGIHFVRQLMDEVHYVRTEAGRNRIVLNKKRKF